MNSQALEPSKQTCVDMVQQVMSVRLEYSRLLPLSSWRLQGGVEPLIYEGARL